MANSKVGMSDEMKKAIEGNEAAFEAARVETDFDIEAVKKRAMRRYPFFSAAVAGVNIIPVNGGTAATDGERIIYNPKFMEKLSEDEQTFVFAHEVCHIAFNHILRSEGKKKFAWNIATDAVINKLLEHDGMKIAQGGVNIEGALNHDAEEMYKRLLEDKDLLNQFRPKKQKKQKGQQGQDGQQDQNGQQQQGQEGQEGQGQGGQGGKGSGGGGGGGMGGIEDDTDDDMDMDDDDDEDGVDNHDLWEEAVKRHHADEKKKQEEKENDKNGKGGKGGDKDEKDKDKDKDKDGGGGGDSKDGKDGGKDGKDKDKQKDGSGNSGKEKDMKDGKSGGGSGSDKNKDEKDGKDKGDGKDGKDGKEESAADKYERERQARIDEQKRQREQRQKELEKMGETGGFKQNKEDRRKQLEDLKAALAKQACGAGDESDGSKLKISNIGTAKPLIDWRYLLREACRHEVDWSYQNAEIENGVLDARLEERAFPETEIVLDTSGSIHAELLRNFLRECKNILQASRVKVGCFDTKFYGFTELRNVHQIDNMEFQGGGGTNFDVAVGAFTRRVENKIVFTDGDAPMPKMPINAIWVVFGNTRINPKGGRVIQIDERQLDRLCGHNFMTNYQTTTPNKPGVPKNINPQIPDNTL